MNNMIVGGALLMYVGVVVSIIDYTNLMEKDTNNNTCMVGFGLFLANFCND